MAEYVERVPVRVGSSLGGTDKVTAADMNTTNDRIDYLEELLGSNPEGEYVNVEERIVGVLLAVAAIVDAKGAANGFAALDSNARLVVAQLPEILDGIVGERFTVANEAAMLALSAGPLDLAAREDTGTVWLMIGEDPSDLASWFNLATAGVASIDGTMTGAVDLTTKYLQLAGGTMTGPILLHSLTPTNSFEAACKAYVDFCVSQIVAGGGNASLVLFSTLPGATDDIKLSNFRSMYRTAFYKPTLVLDELREYNFASQLELFDGFALISLAAITDARRKDGSGTPLGWRQPVGQIIKLSQPSLRGWLRANTLPTSGNPSTPSGSEASRIYGVRIFGASFVANANSYVLDPTSPATIWTSVFRDISYINGPSFCGSSSQQQLLNATIFDGYWNINNVTDCGMHLGGSDNEFVPSELLIDTPSGTGSMSTFLLRLGSLSKSDVKHLYITCEQKLGLLIQGSSGQQMVRISDSTIEGRNEGLPAYGSAVRVRGAHATFSNSWIGFAMSNPSGGQGGSTANRGVVDVASSGGSASILVMDKVFYRCATGVATTVPFMYVAAGSTAYLSQIIGDAGHGSLPFRPVVIAEVGARVHFDDSVQCFKTDGTTPITSGVTVS